ncbi:four helix bundle protein [Sulfurovum sp. ST-21]|uniref:Four helix bundle protein n=1 Tax=Sulfurovum indicum TaxID=2779528 RepID=A0A7M1S5J1_9BACT|nr:four helix bundle protein [Sulfurovum indicum]QOR62342.1 four helix bundle protein [Sulfurovum indicum]
MKCESLDVWKKSAALSADIYLNLSELKDYGFRDQLTRSGLSIPSNIAEGLERISDQEKIRFLDIARASLAEAKTQIYIGIKIYYIPKEKGQTWITELEIIGKMLSALINSIKKDMES